MKKKTISFITGNRCFGNIVRDFRLMKLIKEKEDVEFLHFVPEALRHVYEAFLKTENIETENSFYPPERQPLSAMSRMLVQKRPAVVVSDLAFFGPIVSRILGLKNILITQPYPIRGTYADDHNNCVESLACADQIILPVPLFFPLDPELEKHTQKTMFVGPLIPKEKAVPPGKDLLITYSSGFYGLKLHFDIIPSVERFLEVCPDMNILMHTGGLSRREDVEALTTMVARLPESCRERVRVVGFVENLIHVLKQSRAVVCHGGNIMFEAAMVGIPRLLVVPALERTTEHYMNASYLQRIGAAELAFLGDPIEEKVVSILTDERIRTYQIEAGKRICTWDGLEKTAQTILSTAGQVH